MSIHAQSHTYTLGHPVIYEHLDLLFLIQLLTKFPNLHLGLFNYISLLHNGKSIKYRYIVNILDDLRKECLLRELIELVSQISQLLHFLIMLVNEVFFLHWKLVSNPKGRKFLPIHCGTGLL